MIDLKENEIEIIICPANESKIASAEVGVKIKHIPTNITVESITEKTQHANKNIAIDKLQREISKQVKNAFDNNQDLYSELLSVFKKESHAIRWLTSPKAPLENIAPLLSLIATIDGKKKVMDMLYKIKTGDFS
jgi:protein subunit release factor B